MVTLNHVVIATFDREFALEACLVSFASLYVFDVSYRTDANDKNFSPNIKTYYDFWTIGLFQMRPKDKVVGKEKPKKKQLPAKLKQLCSEISPVFKLPH